MIFLRILDRIMPWIFCGGVRLHLSRRYQTAVVNRKYTVIYCLLLPWIIWCSVANAALNLELTQGKSAAMPIAVLPFTGQAVDPKQAAGAGNNVAYIVQQDLLNSGQFYAYPWSQLTHRPLLDAPFDQGYWRKLGVEDVLLGHVQLLPSGRYKIIFKLLSVYPQSSVAAVKPGATKQSSAATINATNSHLLLTQETQVTAGQLRAAAHHISDAIYQALLGTRGVFSTRIAYVSWHITQQYSAQQKRIVPRYRWSLQLADADGYNSKTLFASAWPIMSPAWSPDGKNIAYVSFERNQAQIFIQNIATGKRTLLSNLAGVNGAPAFSPDGKSIALVLSVSGRSKIYIKALPSGSAQPLVSQASDATIETEPTWAPDGHSLVFTSDQGGTPQLYHYAVGSTGSPQRLSFSGNYNAHANFLPNGKQLVCMHRSIGSTVFNIAKLDIDSGKITNLTQDITSLSPSVAPNGQMVLYVTRYAGHNVLAEVSIDGQVKLRLPQSLLVNDAAAGEVIEVKDPAWSPFLD